MTRPHYINKWAFFKTSLLLLILSFNIPLCAQNHTYMGIHSGYLQEKNFSGQFIGLTGSPSKGESFQVHMELNVGNMSYSDSKLQIIQFNPYLKFKYNRFFIKPYVMGGVGLFIWVPKDGSNFNEYMTLNYSLGAHFFQKKKLSFYLQYSSLNTNWLSHLKLLETRSFSIGMELKLQD